MKPPLLYYMLVERYVCNRRGHDTGPIQLAGTSQQYVKCRRCKVNLSV